MLAPRARTFRRGGRRGISEVVGTVILVGLTMVLFATVFAFTSDLGGTQTQPSSAFAASVGYTNSTGNKVTNVSVTHLSGPALDGGPTGNTAIYVVSQRHPSTLPSPFTVAAGLPGASVWKFGQTWTLNIASYGLTAPDNFTISVVSKGQLLYSATVGATAARPPPVLLQVQVTTSPSPPVHGAAFTLSLSAYVGFAVSYSDKVTVNLSELGGATAQSLSGGPGSGVYTFSASITVASAGTDYLFLTATDGNGIHTTYAVALGIS